MAHSPLGRMTALSVSTNPSQAMNDTPAHFIAVCPSCLMRLRVEYEFSGRLVRCRHCDEAFRPFSPDFGPDSESAEYAVGPLPTPERRPDLILPCPSCKTTLSVRARYSGRHVRCGACQHKFRADPDEANPASPHADSASAERDERTPDPDVSPSDFALLTDEIASLRKRNDLLLRRYDELRREVENLKAQLQQLAAGRDAAQSPSAEPKERIAHNSHRLALVGRAPLDDADHPHDGHRATFPFLPERSAASGR
jgi:DNA-directed RNA polymerase subunit M/transcription elongation factor TFIIS